MLIGESAPAFSSAKNLSERGWVVALLAWFLGLSFVLISNESFWIDEISTAHFAAQVSLKTVWHELVQLKWPEIQAPLYMVYVWGWNKLFGSGEWSLRFAGIPWFILGACAFVMAFREKAHRIFALLLVSLNPFLWFYLNEARLYSMQLGVAFLTLGSLVLLRGSFARREPLELKWLGLFCLGVLLLAMVNVLGMIWASAALLALPGLFSWRTVLQLVRERWAVAGAMSFILIVCGLYYVWTRSLGIMPSTIARTDVRTLLFIVYEQLGFNGLGPGRLSLRETGIAALKPCIPLLLLYAAGVALVFYGALKYLRKTGNRRTALITTLALLVPAGFLVAMAASARFRILGRHFTPFETVVTLLYVLGAVTVWKSGWPGLRVGIAGFLVLSCFSCLSQRFSARHARDDYRGAAQMANNFLTNGRSVWWNADPFSCEYYHVPATKEKADRKKAWVLVCPEPGFANDVPTPDFVIASKPDVYDSSGALHQFLAERGYVPLKTLPAFVIFQKNQSLDTSASLHKR